MRPTSKGTIGSQQAKRPIFQNQIPQQNTQPNLIKKDSLKLKEISKSIPKERVEEIPLKSNQKPVILEVTKQILKDKVVEPSTPVIKERIEDFPNVVTREKEMNSQANEHVMSDDSDDDDNGFALKKKQKSKEFPNELLNFDNTDAIMNLMKARGCIHFYFFIIKFT